MLCGRVESPRESHASLGQVRSGQTRRAKRTGGLCTSSRNCGQVGARGERRVPLQTLLFRQPSRNCRVPTVQSTIWTQERYGVRVPAGHVLWSDKDHRQWSGGFGDDNPESTLPGGSERGVEHRLRGDRVPLHLHEIARQNRNLINEHPRNQGDHPRPTQFQSNRSPSKAGFFIATEDKLLCSTTSRSRTNWHARH